MSVVLRNRAAQSSSGQVSEANLRGGGSGRGAMGMRRVEKAGERWRHSRDPAAELMPAAAFLGHEPDFQSILEDYRGSPFDPARRRVLGRLMGVFAMDYQGARSQERRFLRRLLAARNAREGYAANRALHLCCVPHAIRRTLALGVAESRFSKGPLTGFLGAVQARMAATTFRLLGPLGRERIWSLLLRAGVHSDGHATVSGDAIIERALILKALAARRHRLGPWAKDGPTALQEIDDFAAGIRGCTRTWLALHTTFLSVDGQHQWSGLGQCSATARAGLMARAECDPHFAWRSHGAKPVYDHPQATNTQATNTQPTNTQATNSQAHAPDPGQEHALPDLDRGPLLDRVRLHQALAEARAHGNSPLEAAAADDLARYIGGGEMTERRLQRKDEAWKILVSNGFDVARPESIEAIRQDARGTYRFEPARAFGDLMCRFSGACYVRRVFSDQITAGADPIGQIKAALNAGLTVPLTVRELEHRHMRAYVALGDVQQPIGNSVAEDATHQPAALSLFEPDSGVLSSIDPRVLLAPKLPQEFGRKARSDAYLAPAALDLLAPPFGIPFPDFGVVDSL